jgi:SAM-dependent methyltransferase
MTLSKRLRADGTPWIKVVIRPVIVKGRRRIQFSYFDPKRDITKNYLPAELDERLDEVLGIPFGRIDVQSTEGDIHVRIDRKGQAVIVREKPSTKREAPDLSHDRQKARALPAVQQDRFLQAIGVTDASGRVRPGMQGKFRQINEFLRILEQVVPEPLPHDRPLRIVDCGCGSAYLTFAAYHYLSTKRGLDVRVVGIDVNEALAANNQALAESLGWVGVEFRASRIADYEPNEPPDVVLSLHACDTATDEAIARGIRWQARAILAAPCCQHELHSQLRPQSGSDASPTSEGGTILRPVLRHGVLRERLADILTDTFRALVLRIVGYRTDVIEFVDPQHTAKNLMIRAVAGLKSGDRLYVRDYNSLKEFWGVTPVVEEMVGDDLRRYLLQKCGRKPGTPERTR